MIISKKIIIFYIILSALFYPFFIFSQNAKLNIYFFYKKNCIHCAAEKKFLEKMEIKYPEINIYKYPVEDIDNLKILSDLAKKHKAEKYIGPVPLTFIGNDFFVGFDNEQKIGAEMEESIKRQISEISSSYGQKEQEIKIPIIGRIDLKKYSLPAISVMLGFLDGFNVCSLGALVLIIALLLAFRSRIKIIIVGGVFLLTSAIIYGILIFLWHSLFRVISPYLKIMEFLIGALAIVGSFYFLRQFVKFQKSGVNCDIKSSLGIASKLTSKVQDSLRSPRNIWLIAFSVLLFAGAITIIEFPCSAVIPVVYSGVLSQSNLAFPTVILYLSIYVLFYLLDEILVFFIAIFTMRLWITSPKFIKWITLLESLILFLLGAYYLI